MTQPTPTGAHASIANPVMATAGLPDDLARVLRDPSITVPQDEDVWTLIGKAWVRQQDAEGCGIAVLAMLTGKPYATIKAQIDAEDGHGHDGDWERNGITHITLDAFLIAEGFYLQRVYERMVPVWPPEPWAELHFASVKQPSGNSHFVVMLADGTVLDPLREGTHRLADWPGVNNVVGLKR